MADTVEAAGLKVAGALHAFMENEALPGTGVEPARFWSSFAAIVRDLAPANAALLRKRDELQAKIDGWHREHPARPVDLAAYTAFLREIGYLLPEGPDFAVGTTGVDAGDRAHRRAAARGAGVQRPLRAERRQRPLGQPLRRALRHGRHPGDGRRASAAAATTRRAGAR